jgi:hypothetical protein
MLHDKSTPVDALDEWLSNTPIFTNTDPITYWAAMRATGHPLARMAINFLSIPGVLLTDCILLILLIRVCSNLN